MKHASFNFEAGAVDIEDPFTTRQDGVSNTLKCRSGRHLANSNDKANSSLALLDQSNRNDSSSALISTRPFVPTLAFTVIIAFVFIRPVAPLFDRPLPLSLTNRFLLASTYFIALTTAAGRYPSTMLYDYSHKCLVCPKLNNAAPCTNCECSYYCSIECKVVDLPVHRTLCKSFAQFKDRSDPAIRRAIYLPVDGPNPEFVWLEMDEKTQYDLVDTAAVRENFLGESGDVFTIRIEQDMVSMRRTYDKNPPIIVLAYGETPPYTDQPLNRSISTLLGKETHGVRGPVIAYGLLFPNDEGIHPVTDLDTTDLPVIAN